jgi:hypothetical protein
MNETLKTVAWSLVTTTLLAASTSAVAAEPDRRGIYVGAMGGATEFDDDGLFQGFSYDDSDSGYGVYGGYKFLKYLAVEARVFDVGFDSKGYSGHVVGIVPFGTSGWEIFGQLGIGRIDVFEVQDETVGSAGLGVRFYPTPSLGISVQTDAYVFEEFDYNPSFGATQLAIHWLF